MPRFKVIELKTGSLDCRSGPGHDLHQQLTIRDSGGRLFQRLI